MTELSVRRFSRGPLVAAIASVGLVVAVVTGALVSRDDGPQALAAQPAAQVTSIQQGCQQWVSQDSRREPAETPAWCTDLTNWMTEHMTRTGMGPQMMFGDAQQMQSTCRQWMTETPPAGANAVAGADWCDSMTSWMSQHMGTWTERDNWSDWMKHGSTMGR